MPFQHGVSVKPRGCVLKTLIGDFGSQNSFCDYHLFNFWYVCRQINHN